MAVEVKRLALAHTTSGAVCMEESKAGGFVRVEDYEALLADARGMENALDDIMVDSNDHWAIERAEDALAAYGGHL